MARERIYVVGDLHGCADELSVLLDAVGPTERDTFCFLGDYVDRGPSPRGVIDRLIELRDSGPTCVFLRGNHEDMLLAYMGRGGRYGDAFLANGGSTTLASYGLLHERGPELAEHLPPEHLDFLLNLEMRFSCGSYLCVHAGVDPRRSLDDQRDEDLVWIREEFIASEHPFPYTILFGHTPQREILVHLPYKIGLDTGLVYGNKLSALELHGKELLQVRRQSGQVMRSDLSDLFAESVPAQP